MQLILASQSEGRKKLLSLLKIPFKIIPSTLDEEKIVGKTPLETLELRARRKGEEVVKKIQRVKDSKSQNNKPTTHNPINQITRTYHLKPKTCFILSADSGAILHDQLIGKPKDYQDAVKILKTLSGKTHEFVTTVYLIRLIGQIRPIKKIWQTYSRTLVTFRQLTDQDIKLYLSLTEYTKYAAGYTLSATPQNFITRVEGSLSNVIGLPLEKVIPLLKSYDLL